MMGQAKNPQANVQLGPAFFGSAWPGWSKTRSWQITTENGIHFKATLKFKGL